MSTAKIHHELCAVYSQTAVSEGTVGQWYRMFKDGRTNVHNEERSGWPSVLSDALVQSFDQKICERRHFTISELSCELPQISRTLINKLGSTVTSFAQHGFRKCSQVRRKSRDIFSVDFLKQCHKDGNEFLDHIV
jgi:hypothetical protein